MATLLILKMLPRDEAGRFALLIELLYTIGLVASLGQYALQARLYYRDGAHNFDWVRDAQSTVWMTGPAVAIAVIALAAPYHLSRFEGMFIFAGAELFILTSCFSAVLSQQRHYAWGSALVRLGNGLMIIPAGLMLINSSWRRLDFLLVSQLIFLAAVVMLGTILLGRWLKRGARAISLRDRISGLVFLASLVAVAVLQRGLVVVGGAFLDPGTIAGMAALISFLRVFDLVGESAGRVFSTEMAQHAGRITPGLFAAPWLLAGVLTAGVLVALPPVVHQFYHGRYDTALPLLGWLVIAAASRFVEVVPRGFLAYTAPPPLLNRFAMSQCLVAAIGVPLMLFFAKTQGAMGLVRATAVVSLFRLATSYLFMIPLRRGTIKSGTRRDDLVIEPFQPAGQEPPV